MYEKLLYLTAGYFGVITTYFFGEWTDALQLLTFLVVADFVTGIYASFMEGKEDPNNPNKGINSMKGYWGIFKKLLMFMVIVILHMLDKILGTASSLSLMSGGVYFYLFNELLSLVENLGRAGVPVPEQLKRGITALKTKSGVSDSNLLPTQEEIAQGEIENPIEPTNDAIVNTEETNNNQN